MTRPRFSVMTFVVCALSFTSVALIKYGAYQLRGQPVQAPATVSREDLKEAPEDNGGDETSATTPAETGP